MRKLYLLSLLLPLWTLLPLWGQGGCLFAAVQVKNISTDYANKRVTFALSWAVGTRDATHLSKVWVLVDYQAVTNPNTTGAWQRATVVSATATTGTVSGNTGRGFFLQGTDGAFSSTVTVTLSGVPAKFNWCATATDYPPNAVMSNGTYTLKGTTPFTINGSTSVSTRTYTGACITSITDPTGCPGTVTNPAFSTGTIASTGQTICIGGTPSNIGSTATATGGDSRITYQWYKNGTAISSATATTYTPPAGDAAATASHTYTRRAKDATCNTTLTASAGSWVLKVVADPTITISAAQSICYNTAGSALTATVSGGSGANTYTWQYSANNSSWTAAGTSTANTLTTGNLTANRYYRVMTTQAGSGCASAYSSAVLKTVNPLPGGASITVTSTACEKIIVSATGTNTTSWVWSNVNSSSGAAATVTAVGARTVYATPVNSCGSGTQVSRSVTVAACCGARDANVGTGGCCQSGLTLVGGYCRNLSADGASTYTGCGIEVKAADAASFNNTANSGCPAGWRWPTTSELLCLAKAGVLAAPNPNTVTQYIANEGCSMEGAGRYATVASIPKSGPWICYCDGDPTCNPCSGSLLAASSWHIGGCNAGKCTCYAYGGVQYDNRIRCVR